MNRLVVVVALGLVALMSLSAQRATPHASPPAPRAPRVERAVPFHVGETLTYDVSWSAYVTAGTAVATVKEKKPSFNSTAYYIVAEGRPTPLVAKLYSLYYKLDTLLDSYTLLPQRGTVYSEEGSKHRFKVSRFDHAARKVSFEYESTLKASDTFSVPPYTQDALSAIYVLRAVPFKSGERLTMPICDNGLNYKLQIDTTGPESVRTGLGNLSAMRLNLTLFDQRNQRVGRNTALWMSDDARRLPVKLQAQLPVGSFNLVLREAR